MKSRIRTRTVVALMLMSIALPVHAQLVADGATNTLSNVTNTATGDVTVGTNGSFTLLVLSDNTLLTNSVNGIIGRNATAKSNAVHLLSPTARWRMGGSLFIGSNGASSQLTVSNGAWVDNLIGALGQTAASSNNTVLVTDGGSLWNNRADLNIGGSGPNNQMIVSNGGRVHSFNGRLGRFNTTSSSNLVVVTGTGSVWSNVSALTVGNISPGNRLLIEAGGLVYCGNGSIGNSLAGSSNNEVIVTGPGSLWTNSSSLGFGSQALNRLMVSNGAAVRSLTSIVSSSNQVVVTGSGSVWSNQSLFVGGVRSRVDVADGGWLANSDSYIGQGFGADSNTVVLAGGGSGWNNLASFFLGDQGSGNVMIASNGATVLSSNAFIGAGTSGGANNLALLMGIGTLWSNRNDFTVGNFNDGNRLEINNDATVVVGGNLVIGANSSSESNRVSVTGGTLCVTNGLGTGTLDVRRGTNVINGGFVEVDQLLVTNTSGRVDLLAGGTLAAGKTTINNGQLFRVGNGSGFCTFRLAGNGTHTFANGLTVFANSTLTGNGSIDGALTVNSGGAFRPGAPIGKIVLSESPLVAGSVAMEISKNGSTLTNNVVQLGVPLIYGGGLSVTKIGPTALAPGDSFRLFSALSFGGGFSSVTLPPLPGGLTWTNKLLVNGSIEVLGVSQTVQTLAASALSLTNATLNGLANPKGSSMFAWFEWGTSTNYGNVTSTQVLGHGTNNTNFSETLTGLVAGVTYHFRAVGSNAMGLVFGNDLTFPNLTYQAYLKASNTGSNDLFGFGMSLSGNTLVIGARFESSGATGINGDQNNDSAVGAGAAYVFVRTGTNWTQQAYLKASNTDSNDQFGTSVGISSDTIVVGARFESSSSTGVNGNEGDNSAPNAGAAYVFVRNGTNWTQQAYLNASNTGAGDTFGQRLAISGDTIVVGAPLEDSNATGINGDGGNNTTADSGAAYVFVRNGTNWTQQAYLKASNTGTGDNFGQFVAISGDTIVVGAFQEDSNATGVNGNGSNNTAMDSGAAYVFVRNGTNWTQQAYLKASNTGAGDVFGVTVGVSGDTAAIGAYFESSNATGVNGDQLNNDSLFAGAVYVFERSGTNWAQQAYFKPSNNNVFRAFQFGFGLAISSDTVVVGAVLEGSDATGVDGDQDNYDAPSSGAAYVFRRNGTNWTQQAYLKASNTGTGDLFGNAVVVSDAMVVVGARVEDSAATGVNGDESDDSATDSGAAYVFDFPITPAPVLSIAPSGVSQITLSWTPTLGFVLQESLNLAAVSWTNSLSGETNPITLPVSSQAKFFRLFKP